MNHIACKGKIASVLEDLGYSPKRIKEIYKLFLNIKIRIDA